MCLCAHLSIKSNALSMKLSGFPNLSHAPTGIEGGDEEAIRINATLLYPSQVKGQITAESTYIAGKTNLAQVYLQGVPDDKFVCLEDALANGPQGQVPVSVICNSDFFTPNVIYSVEPVDKDGVVTVKVQSDMNVTGFQFEVVDTQGAPVQILSTTEGSAGRRARMF